MAETPTTEASHPHVPDAFLDAADREIERRNAVIRERIFEMRNIAFVKGLWGTRAAG